MKNSLQVGLTRMDAALDAMRPLGFSAQVVRKSVKKLLEVSDSISFVFQIYFQCCGIYEFLDLLLLF